MLFPILGLVAVAAAKAVLDSPIQPDGCKVIASKLPFVAPEEALACLRTFSFNETLRSNILANANGVLDFYTFEYYYLNSPPPFQESTIDIRAELRKLKTKKYTYDYDFQVELYNVSGLLNDGHTRYFPNCYTTFQNLLPAPIVSLLKNGTEDVYIIPDLVELINLLPQAYRDYLAKKNFNWQRLAGAKVVEIESKPAYDYVDYVAKVGSSNYLDHGVRVNSVYSSYRIQANAWSQRFGQFAGPSLPTTKGVTMKVIVANSTTAEKIFVPYVANFVGATFTDKTSYWANNCAPTPDTNGEDLLAGASSFRRPAPQRPQPMGYIVPEEKKSVGLPGPYQPTAPVLSAGSSLLFYKLPNSTVGVVVIGDFYPTSYYAFQSQAVDGIRKLKAAGATSLIVDVHNNGGGYLCLGSFFFTLLAGTNAGYAGFQTSMRYNPVAATIVDRIIEQDIEFLNYTPDNWAFLNDTIQPNDYNYMSPPSHILVNGVDNKNSQRFHDTCQQYSYNTSLPFYADPPFALNKVIIVGNGNCASTCASFTTLMTERYNVKELVFGVKPGAQTEYKGMAGNQVLDWPDLATEIKTMKAQDQPGAPPDLLVDGNFRVNWRTAWSYRDESRPIAYVSEPATRVPYTVDTYNNPQNLWTQVATTYGL